MKPEHLPLLNSVSPPAVHPDGSRAVVSVSRPDLNADSYVGQLWTVPLDQEKLPRRITRGFRDTEPAFSPDGLVLAFLRADGASSKAQLCVVEADGGEPQIITDRLLGVETFSWSPDSHRIVFSSRDPATGRYGTAVDVAAEAEMPRLVSTYQYRLNGVGYTRDKPRQLFVVEVPELGGEPGAPQPNCRKVTSLSTDVGTGTFSADGSAVYFTALPPDDNDGLATAIYRVPAAGGEPVAVELAGPTAQSVADVRESRDGRWLFYIARDLGGSGMDFVARNAVLFCLPSRGGEPVPLTDPEMMDVAAPGSRIELRGPDRALALNKAQGTVELLELGATGGHSLLVHGDRAVTAAAWAGGSLFVAFADPSTSGDLGVLEAGQLRILTDFSADLRTRTDIVVPQDVTFDAPDGYPVHGWVLRPAGQGLHPVLLNIHGGPFTQFTVALFDEAQVYVAAGYAVLMCNPRGSAGYGRDHGLVIKGRFGTDDMHDVLAFLDGALAKYPTLDAGRLGIMGGSYGGYLTAWTIAHHQRFEAAIVERGFLDPVSFEGSADIGWYFGAEYLGSSAAALVAQSPLELAAKVEAPTLVIHSENDLRCPLEQGQRYYTALKRQGVEAELLIFPGEDHELSRSGRPLHRRQRFDHILRWWARFLPTPANPAEAPHR
ncbi:MAG: S9 family peptidase [Pseudarthrobacter sp.]